MTVYLTLEDVLMLVEELGVGPLRDLGLLESAVHRPTTSLWGVEAYPSLDEKAAALVESLVRNHGLVDGNKRLAWLALVVFYGLNGVDVSVDDDRAYELIIGIAEGRMTLTEITTELRRWR